MQSESLEQLKRLVLDGSFDEESKKEVQALELRLKKAAETAKLREVPAIKDFLDYMEAEIGRCRLMLSTDERLSDLQRSKLFAIIQVSEKYTSLFNGSQVRDVEASIRQALDIAKS